MSQKILKATHAGTLMIGDAAIPCAVLEDGTRVLTQSGFLKALGRSTRPSGQGKIGFEQLPAFLRSNSLKPYITEDLIASTKPIPFIPTGGGKALGFGADLLPKVCDVFLSARDDDALNHQQIRLAEQCDILMRGLAHVGITGLVDEATGYQEVRDRLALQKILDRYLKDEWSKWTKIFPNTFYRELFRLKDVPYPPSDSGKKPGYVGHWTNDIVYSRLAPGVLKKLRDINPRKDSGSRARKHHQHLTDEHGVPELKQHLYAVEALMRGSTSWEDFKRRLERAFTKYGDTLPLEMDETG